MAPQGRMALVDPKDLRDTAEKIRTDLVELRRSVHREPEIGRDLPLTQGKVLAGLTGLPLEITTGRALSSVTAVLRGGSAGPSVLLRADMDALPVTERTGVPYESTIDGAMHACGHDLHVAMLVGAARLLCGVRDRIAGNVIFMFQPAEEGPGGAELMIEEGVLAAAGDRPVAAYGLHVVSSKYPYGSFTASRGPLLASSDTLYVDVHGAGGHGSQPHRAKDPIPAACEMVTALQTYVTRNHDIFDPVVVTVGSFHAGTVENVIPAQARFAATIRSFSPQARERVRRGVTDVVTGLAQAYGLGIDIEYESGYPVTVNHAAEAEFVAAAVGDLFGSDRFSWMAHPEPGAEDFSYVLEQVPGAFVFLGACPPDRDPDSAAPNHSPEATFDDGVLADGAVLLTEVALRRLAQAGDGATP
jgi:amidohydrolase